MNQTEIEQLCRPAAFDHPAGDLVLRETHISWVILCGDFAYKIKRPVDFGFLDFSTLERRHRFCELELALNRRFAPELYLGVVPVTASPRGPEVAGGGAVMDYAVKMRRFDERQLLDNIAARDELDRGLVRALGSELGRLHAVLPRHYPDPDSADPGTPAALLRACEQNFDQISQYPLGRGERRRLEVVRAWTRKQHESLLGMMKTRIGEGWVIDGHGDVHLGNIALIEGAVTLFDCIEFNPGFRIIDSIGEIALLTMDLEARGHPGESHQLLNDYLEYRGDFGGLALLDLYRCYYAVVRAKVNLLREPADSPGLESTAAYLELRRYLALAHRYCRSPDLFLAITHGVSGSGKSTAADKLVAECGAVRLRSDVERKRLFGLQPEQRCDADDVPMLYSPAMTQQTFDRLEHLAQEVLAAGFPVIVDATFLHRAVRGAFQSLARRLDLPFAILDCSADPEELRRRLRQRSRTGADASDAGVEVMERQLEQLEPLAGEEIDRRVAVDSGAAGRVLWRRLRQALKPRPAGLPPGAPKQ